MLSARCRTRSPEEATHREPCRSSSDQRPPDRHRHLGCPPWLLGDCQRFAGVAVGQAAWRIICRTPALGLPKISSAVRHAGERGCRRADLVGWITGTLALLNPPFIGFLARKCDVGLRLSGIWRKRRIAIGRRVGWLWTPPLPLWPKSPPSTVRSSWRIAGAAVAVRLVVESPPTALMLRSPFASLAAVAAVHDPYLPTPLLLREHQLHLDPVSWPVGCRGFASTTICSGDSDPGVKAWLRCPGPRRDSGQISAASSALTEARTHER